MKTIGETDTSSHLFDGIPGPAQTLAGDGNPPLLQIPLRAAPEPRTKTTGEMIWTVATLRRQLRHRARIRQKTLDFLSGQVQGVLTAFQLAAQFRRQGAHRGR